MKESKYPKPPRLLSELLTLAIDDMRRLDTDTYEFNHGAWHRPDGLCGVCLAGAVMAGTLGFNHGIKAIPILCGEWENYVYALDCARMGDYREAYEYINDSTGIRDVLEDRWQGFLQELHGVPEPIHREFVGRHQAMEFALSLEGIIDIIAGIEESHGLQPPTNENQ